MKYLIYNPFGWVLLFWLVVIVYTWCSRHFYFEGSWKHLDKSIHWRR